MKKKHQLALRMAAIVLIIANLGFFSSPVRGTMTQNDILIDVPFISQIAFKDAVDNQGKPYYLGNSSILLWTDGCGVASLAMVFQKWGLDTCLPCLNDSLKKTGGFSGALLAFNNFEGLINAGSPFIYGISDYKTSKPEDYQIRVDSELVSGRPVIAFINNVHFVVITGKNKEGEYLVNDPWKPNPNQGKNIPIDENVTGLGFDYIRRFIFIYPNEYAPTNGMVVQGNIQNAYLAAGGSAGIFGNPVNEVTDDNYFNELYPVQEFQGGVIIDVNGEVRSITGPLWEEIKSLGGFDKIGIPNTSEYFYWSTNSVIHVVDFENMTLHWNDSSPQDNVDILYVDDPQTIRVEYYNQSEIDEQPVYFGLTRAISYDWKQDRPIPIVNPDHFAVRWTATLNVPLFTGWFYTFRQSVEGRYRLIIDGEIVVDGWNQPISNKFTKHLGQGEHTIEVEFSKKGETSRVYTAWVAWPASPVFAAGEVNGPVDFLPGSVTDYIENIDNLDGDIAHQNIIAYLAGSSNIELLIDNEKMAVTNDSFQGDNYKYYTGPQISPDGQLLAYCVNEGNMSGSQQKIIITTLENETISVIDNSAYCDFEWFSNSSTLIYVKYSALPYHGDTVQGVWSYDLGLKKNKELIQPVDNVPFYDLQISPNNKWVLLSSYPYPENIYYFLWNLDNNKYELIKQTSVFSGVTWSKENKIIFWHGNEISILTPETLQSTPYYSTGEGLVISSVSVSPDGNNVVFNKGSYSMITASQIAGVLFVDNTEIQIEPRGISNVIWANDSASFYYLLDGNILKVYDIRTKSSQLLMEGVISFDWNSSLHR